MSPIVFWYKEEKRAKLGCNDFTNLRPNPKSGEAVAENMVCEAEYEKKPYFCIVLLIDQGMFVYY